MTKHCKYCEEYTGDRTDGFCSDICSKLFSRDAPMPASARGMIEEVGEFTKRQTAQKEERIKHVIKEHTENGIMRLSATAIAERFGVDSELVHRLRGELGIKNGDYGDYGGPCETYGVHQS